MSSPYGPYDVLIVYQEAITAEDPDVGTMVCFNGKASGWQFAEIENINYYGSGYRDDGSYMSFHGMVLTTPVTVDHGDSGGSVVVENADGTCTAVGIIKGMNTRTNQYGVQEKRMYYSRLCNIRSAISGLSVADFSG